MYKPSLLFRNPHFSTIYPSIYRKIDGVKYERERFTTKDKDFVDLDWIKSGNRRLVVLTHGLEGHSGRHYIAGTAKLFSNNNWDILAWNCRSCSGEINVTPKLYHHGATEDLHEIINKVETEYEYDKIFLLGYSMGGSITTKFLSEIDDEERFIIGGAAVSTPFDVKGSALELNKPGRGFYRKRFLKKLKKKLAIKAEQFPEVISSENLSKVNTFEDLDTLYSAPLNGFNDLDSFYRYISAQTYLDKIKKPLYILSAQNDPILSQSCFPVKQANENPLIFLEITKFGGHTGFIRKGNEFTYAEEKCLEFAQQLT